MAAITIQNQLRTMQAKKEAQDRRDRRQEMLRISEGKRGSINFVAKEAWLDPSLTPEEQAEHHAFHKEALRIYIEVDVDESNDVSFMELANGIHTSEHFRRVVSMAYSDRNGLLEGMMAEDPDGSGNFSWREFSGYIDVMMATVRKRKLDYAAVSHGRAFFP
jgi:hypothetical protein